MDNTLLSTGDVRPGSAGKRAVRRIDIIGSMEIVWVILGIAVYVILLKFGGG